MIQNKILICDVLCFRSFASNLIVYKMLTRLKPPEKSVDASGHAAVSIIYTFFY